MLRGRGSLDERGDSPHFTYSPGKEQEREGDERGVMEEWLFKYSARGITHTHTFSLSLSVSESVARKSAGKRLRPRAREQYVYVCLYFEGKTELKNESS